MTLDPADIARKKRRHRNERIAASVLVLILMAVTGGVILWQRRVTEELRRDRRFIPGTTRITPEIELLQEYVRIDTSTPAGAAMGARWLASQLEKRGVHAEVIESAPDRLNVYARVKGREAGSGLLLFNHIDVVPSGGGWSAPPFNANIALNMMWGRGTLDMKAMALCQLLAFVNVARGTEPPQHDLVFLGTADEETGSEHGMRWLLEHRPDVFAEIGYGITEGGITELLSEKMTYFGIEVGGKQLIDLTVEGPSLASIQQARIALEPAMFPRDPQRILPVVRRYFRDIAATRVAFGPSLSDIDGAIRRGQFWRLPTPYRDLTQDSLWASAPFQSSGRWQMVVRMVNLPDVIPDERIAWLEGVVAQHGVRIAEVREKQGPVPMSTTESPLFKLLAKQARKQYGVPAGAQILYSSLTDARFLRPHGIDCYGVCPYPVDLFQSNTIHHTDERIRVDGFMTGIQFMNDVIGEWARAA